MSVTQTNYCLSDTLLTPVLGILEAHYDPYLAAGLVSAGCIAQLSLEGQQLTVGLVYPYPCATGHRQITDTLSAALTQLAGIDEVEYNIDFQPPVNPALSAVASLARVKHVIAVASGKGGVGKSTTTVNLALALAAEGAKVGILDADIYGPSIPLMLGIADFKPSSIEGKSMTPANVYGITAQSIGFLINPEDAAVWRGPMAAGALGQLLSETRWPALDYLVVDMPPGTGDIQLTLSQKVPLSGAVIVTTPQDIALADAKKGINMFQKVNVPVLGIVENMSVYFCPCCGHKAHPFGEHGASHMATRYQVPLLGELPLHIDIREAMDNGVPSVVANPNSEATELYRSIARKVGAELALKQNLTTVSISVSDDE